MRSLSQLMLILCCLLSSTLTVIADPLLQVLPTRIVMAQERSSTVSLVNRGDNAGEYRILLRNIRADDNGTFKAVEEAQEGDQFADKMIRYSPRRITLDARSKQDVRLVVRKPRDLADGEYRSHMVFRKLPKQDNVLEDNDSDELSFSFQPIVEVTIPVIIRHGNLSATSELSDLKLTTKKEAGEDVQAIQVTINRDGNRSLYGDLTVWWKKPNGKETKVAFAKGLSVYVPNQKRISTIPVSFKGTIAGGSLRAEYVEDSTYGGDSRASTTSQL